MMCKTGRIRAGTIASLAVCAAMVVAACGGSDSDSSSGSGDSGRQKTIAVSFPNSTKEGAVQFEMNFAKAKAKELGYKFILDDPQGDLNRQVSTIKTWI